MKYTIYAENEQGEQFTLAEVYEYTLIDIIFEHINDYLTYSSVWVIEEETEV